MLRTLRLCPALLAAMLLALPCVLGSAACQKTEELAPGGVSDDSNLGFEQPDPAEASVGTSAQAQPEAEPQPAGQAATQPQPADEAAPRPQAGSQAGAEPAGGQAAGLGAAKAGCVSVPAHLPLVERCAQAGAKVHTFGNSCAGRCDAIEQGMLCGQAMTDGCKCPQGQCIDDESGCCRAVRR